MGQSSCAIFEAWLLEPEHVWRFDPSICTAAAVGSCARHSPWVPALLSRMSTFKVSCIGLVDERDLQSGF